MKGEYCLKTQDQSMPGKTAQQYPIGGKAASDKNGQSRYTGKKCAYYGLVIIKRPAR
jgi:hypothetical protein